MLKFSRFVELIEAKIDDYKSSIKQISTDHDPNAEFKTPYGIVDHFHKHNPTGDVNHTRWVVDQYKKGNLKQEDAPSMRDTLSDFNRNRNLLQKKQLNQYKDISSLRTALREVKPDPTKAQIKRAEMSKVVHEGSTPVEDSDDLKLYHVHNKEASKELGKGMPWCTSHRDNNLNMFDHYNQRSNNNFYIAHLPREQAPYRKIGIAVGAGEFQDENNERIDHDKLSELVKRNPSLGTTPRLQGARVATTQDHEKHFASLVKNDPENAGKTKISPEFIDKALESADDSIKRVAISHPSASLKHIDKVLDMPSGYENGSLKAAAMANPNITPEHIDRILSSDNEFDHRAKTNAIKSPNATSENIDKALRDEHEFVREKAIQNPNATPDHIDKALDDKEFFVRFTATKHPNLSSSNIDKALQDENERVRGNVITHPNVTSTHIDKALQDVDPMVRTNAIKHPNAELKHIDKAILDPDMYVRNFAINHPKNVQRVFDFLDKKKKA